MPAQSHHPLDTIVFRLVAAVEAYEQEIEALLAAWPDMERYRSVGDRIDEVRRHAVALPTASVQFVTFLIAHTELVHTLWKQANDPVATHRQAIDEARRQHRECAAALLLKGKEMMRARAEAARGA